MPEIKESSWPEKEDREVIGDCDWCSCPIYSDEEWVDGKDGKGFMHKECPIVN